MGSKFDAIRDMRADQAPAPSALWSVRTFLVCLILACLLPGLIGAAALFIHDYRNNRAQLEKNTILTARALVQTVDSYLMRSQAVAQSLSTSRALARGDLAEFHRQARELLAATAPGTNIVLSDTRGQQLVNTLHEYGAALPRHGNDDQVRRVLETGKPAVSNLFVGPVMHRPVVSVDVPVVIGGKVTYVLSVGVLPQQFNEILRSQGLPQDWIAAIFDTTGTIVARTHAADQLVGQKGTAEYIRRIQAIGEGSMETTTVDGTPVLSAFSRSPATRWSVGIGIPRHSLEAATQGSLVLLAFGMSGLFFLGLVLAWITGGRIARSVQALTGPALALGAGEAVPAPRVDILEAAEVANAIATTSELLSRRTTERDLARQELEKHREHLEAEVAERTGALEDAMAALAESERFIKAIADNVAGLVAYWDKDLRCRFANQPYVEWFGRAPQQMLGMRFEDVLGESVYRISEPYARRALAGERQSFYRSQIKPSGEVGHTWITYIPDSDETGAVRGFYALAADVTELKQAELRLQEMNEEMAQARDRAEAASRAKSEFVANMSHEIRTPMNAILGLSSLLEDTPLGEQERDHVAKIKISARSLLGILNDILDFSKIEAGRLELERTPFALEEVLRNTFVIVSANARDKGIATSYHIAPEVPATLLGDPLRLQQVLLNLAGNAVKFTEHGKVTVSARLLAASDAAVTLEFSVRDTGIGIAPEHHERLFEAFSQADNSTSRRFGGTGLGLTISNRLVGLMGGAVTFTSMPGRGSDFRFTAVFGIAEKTCADASPAERLAGLRVLLVEDNEISQKVVAQILRRAGAAMVAAADGAAAMALLRHDGARFDAILMDIRTPAVNGFETARLIRNELKLALPVVAMGSASDAAERERARQAGMDAHIAKPIDAGTLVSTLAALVSESQHV
ncbi:ATP-binding protein [Noviherbaspirillum sp. UKPF54]|uniref:ATP-binding protein n=1 Tax=Noviherbaspirillum sp. UKPF54 TaxID=2601898 RepID=UPI0011B191D2|nr:ATP-binding protein [Noviherbaspirillum sp. UKPF54]QDZ29647.1 response regulator [Noviherbaspirillum sp. UKPF54]